MKFLGIKQAKKKQTQRVEDLLSQTAIEAEYYNEAQITKGDFTNGTNPNTNTTDPILNNFVLGLKDTNKTKKGGSKDG